MVVVFTGNNGWRNIILYLLFGINGLVFLIYSSGYSQAFILELLLLNALALIFYFVGKNKSRAQLVFIVVIIIELVTLTSQIFAPIKPAIVQPIQSDKLNNSSKLIKLNEQEGDNLLSIVLPCADENENMTRTIKSFLRYTRADMLGEIIVVDDGSKQNQREYWEASNEIKEFSEAELEKVKFIRHETTIGLQQSKNNGGDSAIHEFVGFFDCHVRPAEGWEEALIEPIKEDYKTITVPKITAVDYETWELNNSSGTSKCYLTWDMDFKWVDHEASTEINSDLPIMSGGLLLTSNKWLTMTKGLDRGMFGWGGENIDQSLKTWLCGGRIISVPKAIVGHMWRVNAIPQTKARYKPVGNVTANLYRAGMGWCSEYKYKLHQFKKFESRHQFPKAILDFADYDVIKKELQCKSASFFFQHFKDLYIPAGLFPTAVFHIRDKNSGLCLTNNPIPGSALGQPYMMNCKILAQDIEDQFSGKENSKFLGRRREKIFIPQKWHIANKTTSQDRRSSLPVKNCSKSNKNIRPYIENGVICNTQDDYINHNYWDDMKLTGKGIRAWNSDQCLANSHSTVCGVNGSNIDQDIYFNTELGQLVNRKNNLCLDISNQFQEIYTSGSHRLLSNISFMSNISKYVKNSTLRYNRYQRDHIAFRNLRYPDYILMHTDDKDKATSYTKKDLIANYQSIISHKNANQISATGFSKRQLADTEQIRGSMALEIKSCINVFNFIPFGSSYKIELNHSHLCIDRDYASGHVNLTNCDSGLKFDLQFHESGVQLKSGTFCIDSGLNPVIYYQCHTVAGPTQSWSLMEYNTQKAIKSLSEFQALNLEKSKFYIYHADDQCLGYQPPPVVLRPNKKEKLILGNLSYQPLYFNIKIEQCGATKGNVECEIKLVSSTNNKYCLQHRQKEEGSTEVYKPTVAMGFCDTLSKFVNFNLSFNSSENAILEQMGMYLSPYTDKTFTSNGISPILSKKSITLENQPSMTVESNEWIITNESNQNKIKPVLVPDQIEEFKKTFLETAVSIGVQIDGESWVLSELLRTEYKLDNDGLLVLDGYNSIKTEIQTGFGVTTKPCDLVTANWEIVDEIPPFETLQYLHDLYQEMN